MLNVVGEVGTLGNIPKNVFGYDVPDDVKCAEMAWVYAPGGRAQYWTPDESEAHGYRIQPANLNVFARIVEEDKFFDNCKQMPHTGDQQITVSLEM